MDWAIISIPRRDWPIAQGVAQKYGLRLADGEPTLITGSSVERFPLTGPNVWTLEADTKLPGYSEMTHLANTDPMILRRNEMKIIHAIHAKYGVKLPDDRFAGDETARATYAAAADKAAKRN